MTNADRYLTNLPNVADMGEPCMFFGERLWRKSEIQELIRAAGAYLNEASVRADYSDAVLESAEANLRAVLRTDKPT